MLRRLLGIIMAGSAVWLVVVMAGVLGWRGATSAPTYWQPFDPSAIPTFIKQNRTVFVDVTADWCLTCKFNERFILGRTDIIQRLSDSEHIVAMRADWTKPDEKISTYLKTYGRYGIPFNIVYGPSAPQGILLPELLTPTVVSRALDQAMGKQ